MENFQQDRTQPDPANDQANRINRLTDDLSTPARDDTKQESETFSSLSEKIFSDADVKLSSGVRTGGSSLPSEMKSADDLLSFDDESGDQDFDPARSGDSESTPPGPVSPPQEKGGKPRSEVDSTGSPTKTDDSDYDGDDDNEEFFAPGEPGDGPPEAKEKTDREKLQDALATRNEPYRKEIDDIKKTIEKSDGYKKVWDQVSISHGMTSVEIKDDKGDTFRLSNTGNSNIFVVQKGDDTYVINKKEPLLDTKVAASDPKGAKIDWSLDRTLKKQAEHQYYQTTLSLNQQATENRRTSTKDIGLKQVAGAQNVAEQAHNQGLISDFEYASQIGYSGFSYGHDFGDHGTAAKLKEKSLNVLEKSRGSSDPETLDARAQLIQTYIASGRTAQANTLLNKQSDAVESREKDGHSLDHDTFLQRYTLQAQLEQVGRGQDAAKVADRAYDLLLKNPDNLPTHNTGLAIQRDDLLNRYLKESPQRRDQIDKLLDLKVDGVKSLAANEPGSSILSGERSNLISQLKKFGGDNKARLSGVLKDEEGDINALAAREAPDRELIQERRRQLAQDYLTAGEKDRAIRVAEAVIRDHETKEGKPGQQQDDIQKRLNLNSNLAGLADTPLLATFREKTKSLLEAYEKSESGKKNGNGVSSMRKELIEQFTQGNDYKTALSLTDKELAHLNEQKVGEDDQSDVKLTKGNLHEKLGDDKTAQKIFEELIARSANDREKITPLEKLSALYERTKQTDLANKAKQDLEAIKKDLPPQHFKSAAGVAG